MDLSFPFLLLFQFSLFFPLLLAKHTSSLLRSGHQNNELFWLCCLVVHSIFPFQVCGIHFYWVLSMILCCTGAAMEVNISHRTQQEILTTTNLAHPDLFNNALNELIQLMKTVGCLLGAIQLFLLSLWISMGVLMCI